MHHLTACDIRPSAVRDHHERCQRTNHPSSVHWTRRRVPLPKLCPWKLSLWLQRKPLLIWKLPPWIQKRTARDRTNSDYRLRGARERRRSAAFATQRQWTPLMEPTRVVGEGGRVCVCVCCLVELCCHRTHCVAQVKQLGLVFVIPQSHGMVAFHPRRSVAHGSDALLTCRISTAIAPHRWSECLKNCTVSYPRARAARARAG